jgi:hypothetical protein
MIRNVHPGPPFRILSHPGSRIRIRKTEKFTQDILPEIVHHVLEKTTAPCGFRCCSRGGGTARSSLTAVLQLQVTAAKREDYHKS